MQHQEQHLRVGGLLKEAVFGFNDGLVSTFSVIAGLSGAAVENKTVLLAALATLFAGAFSMGLGTYLGSKSEKEHYESERKRELWEMEHMPDAERQEIRDIYGAKGFRGKLLEEVVEQITSDPKVWLKTMMSEELGFAEVPPKPGINGIVMSISFTVGSLIPSFPYFFPSIDGAEKMFFFSLAASVVGLIFAGSFKTKFTKKNVFMSAFETLLIGAIAASGSYGIGVLLS